MVTGLSGLQSAVLQRGSALDRAAKLWSFYCTTCNEPQSVYLFFLPSNCRFCLSGISLLVALPLDSNILVEQKIIHQTFQVWRSVSPISKFIHQFQRTQKIIHQDIELFISDHHVWCPVRFLWAIFSLGLHTSARASRAQPWCVMPKNYGDKIHQRVLNICCIC